MMHPLWEFDSVELMKEPGGPDAYWLVIPHDRADVTVDARKVMVKLPRETLTNLAVFLMKLEADA